MWRPEPLEVVVAVALVFGMAGVVAGDTGGSQDPGVAGRSADDEELVWDFSSAQSRSGEELPRNLRIKIHIEMVARAADIDPYHELILLHEDGLRVSEEQLYYLSDLYGDFDAQQRAKQKAHAIYVGDGDSWYVPPEVGRALVKERAEFIGRIFGKWVRYLSEQGVDVEPFLRTLTNDPPTGVSVTNVGHIPTLEDFNERARLFGDAFAREFGRSLDSFLVQQEEE